MPPKKDKAEKAPKASAEDGMYASGTESSLVYFLLVEYRDTISLANVRSLERCQEM